MRLSRQERGRDKRAENPGREGSRQTGGDDRLVLLAGEKTSGRQVQPDAVRGAPSADGKKEYVARRQGVHGEKEETGSPEQSCQVRAGDPNREQAGREQEHHQPPDGERKYGP